MPFVQIHTARAVSPQVRASLGRALAESYAEFMQTNARIVNVGFLPYAEGNLVRFDAADGSAQEMTIVTCDGRSGRSPEMIEGLGRAITRACSEGLGIPEARVAVYITQHEAHEIYRDGGRAPAWSASEGVPAAV